MNGQKGGFWVSALREGVVDDCVMGSVQVGITQAKPLLGFGAHAHVDLAGPEAGDKAIDWAAPALSLGRRLRSLDLYSLADDSSSFYPLGIAHPWG